MSRSKKAASDEIEASILPASSAWLRTTLSPLAKANVVWAQSKTTIAHAAITTHVAPLWIARDQGIFAKYGIDADVVAVRGAPILVAAITSGAVQVGYTGGSATLGAVAGGVDLKIVATFVNRVVVDLVVKPGIKTAEDLRGKSLGVQSIGGSSGMMAMLALEHLGLDPAAIVFPLIWRHDGP